MSENGCERCAEHEKVIEELRARIARLEKNSGNSSKPPSSDIVKPTSQRKVRSGKRNKRKKGGQKGHPRHERPAFEESQIDQVFDYTLPACPDCGGPVQPTNDEPAIVQQVELKSAPVEITEHRGQACWCKRCQKTYRAPIDDAVRKAGLAGPRLTALVAFLKGGCHCSFTTIRKFLRDVVGVTISRGQLAKLCRKTSDAVDAAYQELLDTLPNEKSLRVDETGHPDSGHRFWTWCFRAKLYTLFKISPSRGSNVLLDVLGSEFDGVLGCDYFSAYRKYMKDCNVLVQFCLAHLIRDIKFLVGHSDHRNRAYGRRLLEAARQLFGLIHRRDRMSKRRPAGLPSGDRKFAAELEEAGNHLWGTAVSRVPRTAEAENMAQRFHQHGDSYIRFITTPDIEPTNNLAEQAIRFVVIDRLVTQGSRGETGRRWLERIWTVTATCAQQKRCVFDFLNQSIAAHFAGKPPPSLLFNTS